MLIPKFFRKLFSVLMLAATGTLLGCNYNRQTEGFYHEYLVGDYVDAAHHSAEVANHAAKRDAAVLRLEEGSLQRCAAEFVPSNGSFAAADQMITQYDDEPDIKVSQESLAVAVNQATLDYRGYAYDKIMMNTYAALNYLELGDMDAARVQLRRAYQRQQEAVDKYAKQIEADKETRREKSGDLNVNEVSSQNNLQERLQAGDTTDTTETNDVNIQDLSAYNNYANPFTEYLRGLYLLYAAVDSSDLEQAATAMRRAAGMMGGNHYVKDDAETAEKAANGGHIEPTTYVIYEAGVAPVRTEFRLDLPIPYSTRGRLGVDVLSVAFPILKSIPCRAPLATVDVQGHSYETAVVCNMDNVVRQEFKNDLPIVITRTLISAALKAAAQYGSRQIRGDAGIIANVVTSVYTVATNEADLRTWKSLPKLFSVARFPTPADRHVRITLGGVRSVDITVADGVVNVIYVKCPDLTATPIVGQFKLK